MTMQEVTVLALWLALVVTIGSVIVMTVIQLVLDILRLAYINSAERKALHNPDIKLLETTLLLRRKISERWALKSLFVLTPLRALFAGEKSLQMSSNRQDKFQEPSVHSWDDYKSKLEDRLERLEVDINTSESPERNDQVKSKLP